MKISFDTFELLKELGDSRVQQLVENEWDAENCASRNCEPLPSFTYEFLPSEDIQVDKVWTYGRTPLGY